MKRECDAILPLITAWVDEVLPAGQSTQVDAHLAVCAACRGDALKEQAVRRLLRDRVSALHDVASASLRDRLARRPAPLAAASPRRRVAWQLPLAASLVLALLGAGILTPSNVLLAAELALDHVKCRLLATAETGVTPAALEQRWQQDHGWPISVAGTDVETGVRLTGLRRCVFHGGSIAHLLYDYRGQTVSLYVVPGQRQPGTTLAIMGLNAVTWSAGDRTYGLVGDAPQHELARLEAYFQRHLHP